MTKKIDQCDVNTRILAHKEYCFHKGVPLPSELQMEVTLNYESKEAKFCGEDTRNVTRLQQYDT